HRIYTVHTRLIRKLRTGDDDLAKQLWTQFREHNHRPVGLAVADHARLADGVRVQFDDLLEEFGLGAPDIFDGLAGDRLGEKTDEIARGAGPHRHADLAVGL